VEQAVHAIAERSRNIRVDVVNEGSMQFGYGTEKGSEVIFIEDINWTNPP